MRFGHPPATLAGMRCLIVDDSPTFLAAATASLTRDGLTVTGIASTTADALREADASRPDVVLVDISLGDESGVELARRLVERPCGEVPVILISTRDAEEVVELLSASHAAAFLPKGQLSGDAIQRIVADQVDPNAGPGT